MTETKSIETSLPTSDDVLRSAFYVYGDAGLRLPPIPRELVDTLCNYADWHYGTRDVAPGNRAELESEAADFETPSYISFGHVGTGVNNWYIALRLLVGPLAVFVRHRWGGAFGDKEADSVPIHRSFYRLEELIVFAQQALEQGRLAAGERLLVVQDPVQGSGWRIVGRPGSEWSATGDAIESAIASITPAA